MDIEKNTNKIENVENKPLLKSENFNDNSVKEAKRQISFEDSKGKKSHLNFSLIMNGNFYRQNGNNSC